MVRNCSTHSFCRHVDFIGARERVNKRASEQTRGRGISVREKFFTLTTRQCHTFSTTSKLENLFITRQKVAGINWNLLEPSANNFHNGLSSILVVIVILGTRETGAVRLRDTRCVGRGGGRPHVRAKLVMGVWLARSEGIGWESWTVMVLTNYPIPVEIDWRRGNCQWLHTKQSFQGTDKREMITETIKLQRISENSLIVNWNMTDMWMRKRESGKWQKG